MFLGAALMFGAVVLPFTVPGLLGIAVFFLCFVGAWVVWFKGLPLDRALFATGITMGCFAAVLFVLEILIGETILANAIFSLVASFTVLPAVLALMGPPSPRKRVGVAIRWRPQDAIARRSAAIVASERP